MRKSTKHENLKSFEIELDGGLNYSSSPTNLANNELKRSTNWIYDPSTDLIIVRPGTECVTGAVEHKLATPIRKLYYYEKSLVAAWLVCASGAKLYYWSTDEWVEIGALADATTVPSFLTFNNKLLIADGNADIRTWDGTTYGTIASSPQATILAEIKGRVVCNATDEPDSVYMSGSEDETDWNTTTGNALGLKAGFGDMLEVNGFAVFGDDLIVSKKSSTGKTKRLYRIDTSDTTSSNWVCKLLSVNNSCQGSNTIETAFNNIFFCDDDGFKSLKGVQEYGDLQVDQTGEKVNSLFKNNTCDEVKFIPKYNAIFFAVGDRVMVYSEKNQRGRFTDLIFQWGRVRSFCQVGSVVYLAGHNGYLYKFDEALATDETVPSTRVAFQTYLRTKTFTFFNDIVLRKTQVFLTPLIAGSGNLYTINYTGAATAIATITVTAESYPWVETCRNRVRAQALVFEIRLTSGAVGIERIQAEIAIVEGGE